MDNVPETALTDSPNINSVLKPPKQRVPLKDLKTAIPEEDNTAARKRRVSFANVNKIKEFSAGAESMVVCQTPAYEEPFSVSSDSSYPSGVDGWTPAKGQCSFPGKPPVEKENLSIQSVRISSGNSNCSSRYSMNGMDSTEVVEYIDQETRFSLGMDVTNVVGNCSQNTRYSVNGLDLTCMTTSNKGILDQRSIFPYDKNLTNVSHPIQSTRYSIDAMELTSTLNPHETFLDKKSARLSAGMNTMRYSCNAMDLTNIANSYGYEKQTCENDLLSNVSIDVSDTLEITEAIGGVQVSAVSPKYNTNNFGLTENVLYSVNNTRYSVNSMDLTKSAGSRSSTTRRKTSRFSLVNIDLRETLNNDSGDLEITQAITDPRMKLNLTGIQDLRGSVLEMDLETGLVGEGVTIVPQDNMDYTSIVGEQLKYSADTESIINISNNPDPPVDEKENILSNQSLNFLNSSVRKVSNENPTCVGFNRLTDTNETLPEIAPQHAITVNEYDNHSKQPNSSHDSKQKKSELSHNSNFSNGQAPDAPKLNESKTNSVSNESRVINRLSECIPEPEEFNAVENFSEPVSLILMKDEMEKKSLDGVKCSVNNETLGNVENDCEINCKRNVTLDKLNCSPSSLKLLDKDLTDRPLDFDQGKSVKDLKTNTTGLCIDDLEDLENGPKRKGDLKAQLSPNTFQSKDLTLKNEGSEHKIASDDAMELSITENNGFDEGGSNVTEESPLSGIEIPETYMSEKKPETFPEEVNCLNESVKNMTIEDCTVINEGELVEYIDEQVKTNTDKKICVSVPVPDHKINNETNDASDQSIGRGDTINQSIELKLSPNNSLNLSSRSELCNNITMTRGGKKNLILTPDTSLDVSHKDSLIVGNKAITSFQSTSVESKTQSESNNLEKKTNSLKSGTCDKRGKRSFEIALGPENDTEESPVKLQCLSKEEPSIEYEILNNVTAPSFLMETVAASNETISSINQHESISVHQHKSNPVDRNTNSITSPESTRKTDVKLGLLMDDSLTFNKFEYPSRNEVIDLCESSFDATSTEVRELINNSRYNMSFGEVISKQNESSNCSTKSEVSPNLQNLSFYHIQSNKTLHPSPLKEHSNDSSKADVDIGDSIENDVKIISTDSLLPLRNMNSAWRRKREKIRSLGTNSFAAIFIPKMVEIHFSIDSLGNVHSVRYYNICTGADTNIGEYLIKQARNMVLPEKGSDLILQLQSTNKSYLACLAKTLFIICKFHNGRIKGDILTLEVVSCKNHFWILIDINIKHPEYFNQTDITISKQKIGKLSLPHVRKIFNSIEKNENKLLNFAKAMTELQISN